MALRLFAKLIWGVGKLAVKFVLIPILISALIGALLEGASDKLREGTDQNEDGRVDTVIRPEP